MPKINDCYGAETQLREWMIKKYPKAKTIPMNRNAIKPQTTTVNRLFLRMWSSTSNFFAILI